MMKPTQILSGEHRIIEVLLDCLEELTGQALQSHKLDRQPALQIIDVIRNFADKCHHGKEETHLFAKLSDKGMPRESGPVGQMLREHEQGRAFVQTMASSMEAASQGNADALRQFVAGARGYVELLRAHIQKEDGVLFPLADRVLSEAEQETLSGAFARVEAEHMGAGTHEKYFAIAEALAAEFGLSLAGIKTKACGCGH
ncbi:MAG: hemerythrin domain-containing protein [bacterium]